METRTSNHHLCTSTKLINDTVNNTLVSVRRSRSSKNSKNTRPSSQSRNAPRVSGEQELLHKEPLITELYAKATDEQINNMIRYARSRPKKVQQMIQSHGVQDKRMSHAWYNDVADAVSDAVVDPIVDNVVEPVVEYVAEPVYDATTTYIYEPVRDYVAEPVYNWGQDNVYDPVADWTGNNIVDPVTDTISNSIGGLLGLFGGGGGGGSSQPSTAEISQQQAEYEAYLKAQEEYDQYVAQTQAEQQQAYAQYQMQQKIKTVALIGTGAIIAIGTVIFGVKQAQKRKAKQNLQQLGQGNVQPIVQTTEQTLSANAFKGTGAKASASDLDEQP